MGPDARSRREETVKWQTTTTPDENWAGVFSRWEVADPRGRTDIPCADGCNSHNGHAHHWRRPGNEFCDVDSGLFMIISIILAFGRKVR